MLCLLLCLAVSGRAERQGCAQCKDNVGSMPQSTRTAYRDAIMLLLTAGVCVFTAGVFLVRRHR